MEATACWQSRLWRLHEAVGACRWLSVVRGSQFNPLNPTEWRLSDLLSRITFLLVRDLQHVTTVQASGQPRALQQPSDDACSMHCQIQAWDLAALRPIPGPAHTGPKPVSVDGPSFIPARPVSLLGASTASQIPNPQEADL
jgi:hypothetical protein